MNQEICTNIARLKSGYIALEKDFFTMTIFPHSPKLFNPIRPSVTLLDMLKLSFPYREGKYKSGRFQEIEILKAKDKSKYKENQVYLFEAMQKRTIKLEIMVKLVKVEIICWADLDHQMAKAILYTTNYSPTYDNKNITQIPARKGDLMMYLMKRYRDNGFKNSKTKFTILSFRTINEEKAQITFPTFEEIKNPR